MSAGELIMSRTVILAGASGLALLMSGAVALADSYGGVAADYPPNAKPGQCFARVLTPEIYETFTDKVIDTPEKTELRVIPGEWRWEEKTILVREASIEYIVVPGTYKTITIGGGYGPGGPGGPGGSGGPGGGYGPGGPGGPPPGYTGSGYADGVVTVKPGYTRIEVIPATYGTVTEQVLVKEATTVWKPGKGLAGHTPGYGTSPGTGPGYLPAVVDGKPYYGPTKVAPTGELLCLVEIPAEYKTVTKTVVKTPARTVEVAVPPEYKGYTRQVVDIAAHVEKREIPAVYENIRIQVLVRPERVESTTIPATYKVIEKKKLVGGGKLEWREVICDDKLQGPLPANAINCSDAGGSCTPSYTPPVYTPPPHSTSSYGTKGGYETTTTYTAPKPVYAPPPKAYKGTTVTHSYDGERGAYAPAAASATVTAQAQAQSGSAQPATGNMIARMQQALTTRGYYAGPIDGLYTQTTSEALLRFQKDNKMASGQLTLETARALGIWN